MHNAKDIHTYNTDTVCTHTQMSTQTHTHRPFFTHTHAHTHTDTLFPLSHSLSLLWHILSLQHVLSLRSTQTLRWQNVSNLMHCLHVLSLWHVLSLQHYSDKTCWKVHLLHFLSPLHQQHYNLSFLSLDVLVCACMCWCALFRGSARTRPCVCCGVMLFYYPHLNQC